MSTIREVLIENCKGVVQDDKRAGSMANLIQMIINSVDSVHSRYLDKAPDIVKQAYDKKIINDKDIVCSFLKISEVLSFDFDSMTSYTVISYNDYSYTIQFKCPSDADVEKSLHLIFPRNSAIWDINMDGVITNFDEYKVLNALYKDLNDKLTILTRDLLESLKTDTAAITDYIKNCI